MIERGVSDCEVSFLKTEQSISAEDSGLEILELDITSLRFRRNLELLGDFPVLELNRNQKKLVDGTRTQPGTGTASNQN